ncbi:hypothetical protein GCM10027174_12240 [Salinifilum aidingensis]
MLPTALLTSDLGNPKSSGVVEKGGGRVITEKIHGMFTLRELLLSVSDRRGVVPVSSRFE